MFNKIRQGLAKTRESFKRRLDALLGTEAAGEEVFEELEEILVAGDLGVPTAAAVVERVRGSLRGQGRLEAAAVRSALAEELQKVLLKAEAPLAAGREPLTVYLFVGVNGSGKTTSLGKLAFQLREQGQNVLICAADTFRAAASEQLAHWARRAGAGLVTHQPGADPGAVVYDALEAALSRKVDYLLIDTAGRLQSKTNLMAELAKIRRVISRRLDGAPHETLLVLDAGTGQNGMRQAEVFRETAGLTGVVLTKLDGTARGGIALSIAGEYGIPVKLVGVGEGPEDLEPFDAAEYVRSLLS